MSMTLAEMRNPVSKPLGVKAGFDTVGGFELIQRAANLFAASDIVPTQFKNSVANCVIAVDMAIRMHANPLMIMQNLYIVHNRPAWSAQFLIATCNQSGKFSALRYKFEGEQGKDTWGCRACATEVATGEQLEGPLITIGLAKKEGWYSKKDSKGRETSKWQSMPELMLRYRAASWFVRAYAPEISMGLQTADEVSDTYDMEIQPDGSYAPAQARDNTVTVADINATMQGHTAESTPKIEEAPKYETVEEQPAPQPAKAKQPKEAAEPVMQADPPMPEPEPVYASAEPPLPDDSEIPPSTGQQQPLYAASGAPDEIFQCGLESTRMVKEEDCMKCAKRSMCPEWGGGANT